MNKGNISNPTGQDALLIWCRNVVSDYQGVNIKNFDSSWKDGLALCAIVDKFMPGQLNFKDISTKIYTEEKINIIKKALDVAEKNGIQRLIDADDFVILPVPDKASLITYLSQFYHKYSVIEKRRSDLKRQSIKPVSLVVGGSNICASCGKPLSGATVQAIGQNWHQECFKCTSCNKPVVGEKIMKIKDKPYCSECGKKAFTSTFKIGIPMSAPSTLRKIREENASQSSDEIKSDASPNPSTPLVRSNSAKSLNANEDKQEPKPLNHSTLRNRARGPPGRKLPTKTKKIDYEAKARSNTLSAAQSPYFKTENEINSTTNNSATFASSSRLRNINNSNGGTSKTSTRVKNQSGTQQKVKKKKSRNKTDDNLNNYDNLNKSDNNNVIKNNIEENKENIKVKAVEAKRTDKQKRLLEKQQDSMAQRDRDQQTHLSNWLEQKKNFLVDLASSDGYYYAEPDFEELWNGFLHLNHRQSKQIVEEDVQAKDSQLVLKLKELDDLRQCLAQLDEEIGKDDADRDLPLDDAINAGEMPRGGLDDMRKRLSMLDDDYDDFDDRSPTNSSSDLLQRDGDLTASTITQISTLSSSTNSADLNNNNDVMDIASEVMEEVVTYDIDDILHIKLEGFLHKQNVSNKRSKGWHLRWFCLLDNNLVYYKEIQKNVLGRDCPPDGVLPLSSATSIEIVDQPNVFRISMAERSYLFQADCKKDADIWVKYLNQSKQFYASQFEFITTSGIANKKDSEISGWLEKLGRFNKWKKRWFTLKDGMLFRYKSMGGARDQLGKFPLFHSELSEYKPEKMEGRCFELKHKNERIILRATDVESMHTWLNAILKQKIMIEETINSIVIM